MRWLISVPGWIDRQLARPVIFLIRGYQRTVSPDHSACGAGDPTSGCKFFPSCSEYATHVFKKNGLVGGLPRVVWRVLRCNPWSSGGVDLPPGFRVDETERGSTLHPIDSKK